MGLANSTQMVLNDICITLAIHHALFKRRIRSLDPMVLILWPLEKFGPKAENQQLQIDENPIVVQKGATLGCKK